MDCYQRDVVAQIAGAMGRRGIIQGIQDRRGTFRVMRGKSGCDALDPKQIGVSRAVRVYQTVGVEHQDIARGQNRLMAMVGAVVIEIKAES